jgi:uncharacterized membrane protein YkoI
MPGDCRTCPDGRLLIYVSNLSGRLGDICNMRFRAQSAIGRLLVGPAVLLAAAVWQANARDHDTVRRAVESGEIRSLTEILGNIRGKLPGDIVGVEVERKDGRWIYEFRAVDGKGRLYEVYVDARSGEIERVKEK